METNLLGILRRASLLVALRRVAALLVSALVVVILGRHDDVVFGDVVNQCNRQVPLKVTERTVLYGGDGDADA